MKKWVGIAIAALLMFGAVYFGSPYVAARQLKQAAISGDADKLDAAVDFPAVRESLKPQLSAALMRKLHDDRDIRDNPLAGIGALLVPTVVDRMVDAFVTPDGLAALVRGNRPSEMKDQPPAENPSIRYDYEWISVDRFRVRLTNTQTQQKGAAFLFERRGLANWKLVKLELPETLFKN
jgi:hypothetical protein